MNSKISTTLSILLILVGITIWSVSVLAAEPAAMDAPVANIDSTTIDLAISANEEAVNEAARTIQTRNRLDLDIRLVGPTSIQLAAK